MSARNALRENAHKRICPGGGETKQYVLYGGRCSSCAPPADDDLRQAKQRRVCMPFPRPDEIEREAAQPRVCTAPRLTLTLLTAAAVAWRLLSVRGPSPYQHCHGDTPILVGTHHKTGTVLLKHIFLKEVCPTLGWKCSFDNKPYKCSSPEDARAAGLQLCFLQHGIRFKVQETKLAYRFIHAIRDPLEVVLSGYQYHLTTTERWANRVEGRYNHTTYRSYLNSLPLDQGLKAEVKHSFRDSLKTMPRLLNRTSSLPCTMTVRLEDFERDWGGTIRRLWDLLGITDAAMVQRLTKAVAKHNVYTAKRKFNRHVSNVSSRGLMRERVKLMPETYARLVTLRRRLGYPEVGKEK